MGQSTGGTSLTTNAAATSRTVAYRLLVDWADAGFGSEGSWTDESAYVKSVRGTMQATSWRKSIATVGQGMSDVVYVTCRNPRESNGNSGLRFSSTNSNGSLYSNIQEGRINMKRAIFEMGFEQAGSPERLRQITGYIVNVTENFQRREITFEIRDRAADAVLTRTSTTLQTDQTAKEYMVTLCDEFERDTVASGDRIFDDGMVMVPYYWLDEETVWDEMHLVAEAQVGRIWFDKDGDLHFDDGTHFIKENSNAWDDPLTSQATFATSAFSDLSPRFDMGSVFNHIIVEFTPRYVGYVQTIFTASETVVLRPSESNKPYKAEFRHPAYSISTPVEDTDYHAITPGGEDITSSVTVTVDNGYAGHADLLLSNADSDYPAYLTLLQLRGAPLLTQEAIKYEVENATSIGYYGRRTWTVKANPYIQSYRQAEMIGDFLLERFKDPILTCVLRGVPARPWLEPGDRVSVLEALTDLSTAFYIAKIDWTWAPGRPYLMTLTLMRCSDIFSSTNYFTLGTSEYGSGVNKGILFW